jgi:hypothetical protein
MSNVYTLPTDKKKRKLIGRKRVFFMERLLVGEMTSEWVEYYLRREKVVDGYRQWSLIIYDKRQPVEMDWCDDRNLIDMLDTYDLLPYVSNQRLIDIGWGGPLDPKADVFVFPVRNSRLSL